MSITRKLLWAHGISLKCLAIANAPAISVKPLVHVYIQRRLAILFEI
jgi:hypothetical protein